MSISGHIIGGPADADYHGAVLTADLAIGDTVLHVDDVADFDEDAAKRDAQVAIGVNLDGDGEPDMSTGAIALYTGCDDDASTVTLASPSTIAASEGDLIYIVDPVSGGPVGDVVAMVALDDADTTGDALPVILDVALLGSVGDADLTDLAVTLEEDEDGQLYVSSFPGMTGAQGDVKFMQDQLTVTTLGDQTFTLTYKPIKNSEHLYWHPAGGAGIYQKADQWARDQWTLTIPDPDGLIEVGDNIVVEYAYKDPTTKPANPHPDVVIDLPAWDVDDDAHGIIGSDALSVPDPSGSDELVLDQSSQPLGIGIYSTDGTGSGNIVLPATPAGYALTRATYVVTAYRQSTEALVNPSDWSPDTPDPTSAPFLMIETSADGYNRTLDPIPDVYGTDVEWPGNDLAAVLAGTPANRIWLQSYSDIPIYVAYAAVRLTYTWAG